MHKFPIAQYKRFEELPLEKFNQFRFSVYVLDFNWNYLFINDFVSRNLKERANGLIGRNMWEAFPELASDPVFQQIKVSMEKMIPININTTSPLTSQRLNISGYPMDDCYYFTSSVIPDKEELINELRDELSKKHKS